ncbi:hypothetical protein A8950_0965 [Dongia mobilis]|uniref:Uncharacterized protein n=1 Tax=Dongia mobilis TaxID=578943 RepID=A0A4R6WS22_9PROT|nr:hypothetical protein [Dongia mobilis]TDQ84412.1 hypothetical protein A8950_0965 [Dongia mobilis]
MAARLDVLTRDARPQEGRRDDLLRPEPREENVRHERGGAALFGLFLAGFAIFAIYESAPIDLPEFPDCPVQAIGTCGIR